MQMQTNTFGPGVADLSTTLTFYQYNGNLADLVSIQVIGTLDVFGGSASVDNDSDVEATGSVTFGTELTISSPDVDLLDNDFDPILSGVSVQETTNLTLDPNDGDGTVSDIPDVGGGDFDTVDGPVGNDSGNGFVNPVLFADYVGASTFDIDILADTEFDINLGSGVAGSFSGQSVSGSVKIIYTFIPAPGAAGVLAAGGLVLARRRR